MAGRMHAILRAPCLLSLNSAFWCCTMFEYRALSSLCRWQGDPGLLYGTGKRKRAKIKSQLYLLWEHTCTHGLNLAVC